MMWVMIVLFSFMLSIAFASASELTFVLESRLSGAAVALGRSSAAVLPGFHARRCRLSGADVRAEVVAMRRHGFHARPISNQTDVRAVDFQNHRVLCLARGGLAPAHGAHSFKASLAGGLAPARGATSFIASITSLTIGAARGAMRAAVAVHDCPIILFRISVMMSL